MSEGGVPDAAQSMTEFQDWLRQIPGIDEATAISNVINYIEEDKYDVVVFDTAPTGHTLKLLQLPKVEVFVSFRHCETILRYSIVPSKHSVC